jgi:hypothetical protein
MKYTYVLSFVIMLFFVSGLTAQQQRLAIRSYAKNPDSLKKGKYSMDQFLGRWQETARMRSKTKEKTEISDTFYIHFYKEDKADTKQGNSVVITGTSELFIDDYITTSANDFKIISVSPDMIVLDDNVGYQHSMVRTNLFAYEINMSAPVADPDTAQQKIDLTATSLINDWFAYKRGANPGFVKSETPLIRNLRIREKLAENNYKGEIEYARYGKANVEPCTLSFTGNRVTIVAGGNTWNIEVYKVDGQEMILGKKGELVYYFKHGN